MARTIVFYVMLTLATFVAHAQKMAIIDGDKLHMRDSLDGKVLLLSFIEREDQNRDPV